MFRISLAPGTCIILERASLLMMITRGLAAEVGRGETSMSWANGGNSFFSWKSSSNLWPWVIGAIFFVLSSGIYSARRVVFLQFCEGFWLPSGFQDFNICRQY